MAAFAMMVPEESFRVEEEGAVVGVLEGGGKDGEIQQ